MTAILNITVAIAAITGVVVCLMLLFSIATVFIKEHNIKKYGYWWGNLPEWFTDLMDLF